MSLCADLGGVKPGPFGPAPVLERYDLWVAEESTRHALSPDSARSPREPPLRRAVATTPARPRSAVPRRARRALAATSAQAHRGPSIGRPARGGVPVSAWRPSPRG